MSSVLFCHTIAEAFDMRDEDGETGPGKATPCTAERDVLWDEEELLRRLRRLEGQIRGIQGMIQRRASCTAILTQMAAAEGALMQVHRIVAACHLLEGLDAPPAWSDRDEFRQRLNELLRRL
jgi:DNA-binding FrmR family transcriptional regulator